MMQRIMSTNFCEKTNVFVHKLDFHLLQIVVVNLKRENKNISIIMASECNYRPI